MHMQPNLNPNVLLNKSENEIVHDAMVVGSIIAQAQGRSHTGAVPNANVRPNVSLQSYSTSSIIDTGGSLLMVDRLMQAQGRTCTSNQIQTRTSSLIIPPNTSRRHRHRYKRMVDRLIQAQGRT